MQAETKLEAQIELLPFKLSRGNLEAIKPETPLIISVKIKNTGTKYNEKGYFYVRFAPSFERNSKENFTTEKVELPSIAPEKQAYIIFKTPHLTPNIDDFIKLNYANYPYQAIAVIDSKEYIIGQVNLKFSAYYFSGPNQEIEKQVPSIHEL